MNEEEEYESLDEIMQEMADWVQQVEAEEQENIKEEATLINKTLQEI